MYPAMPTLAQDLAPVYSPRTTIPPPASGVFTAAYPLFAMIAVEAFEPPADETANDGVPTDIDELSGASADDVHACPTERP